METNKNVGLVVKSRVMAELSRRARQLAGMLAIAAACSSVACSHAGRMAGLTTAASAARCYDDADVKVILDLREQGESRAAIAKVVGGTKADIRRVEQERRALGRAVSAGSFPTTTGDGYAFGASACGSLAQLGQPSR